MTNYYMQAGAKRNKRIKIVKNVLLCLVVVFIVGIWFKWNIEQTDKIMSIQYCWDSEGDHYVAPDERCVR